MNDLAQGVDNSVDGQHNRDIDHFIKAQELHLWNFDSFQLHNRNVHHSEDTVDDEKIT